MATGIGSGTATITAASGGVTGTSTITVSSPALTGIGVTPGTATVQAGTGTQQFTATCTYANSSTTNCTTDVTWSSSSATTIVITGNGVATGVAPGSAVLTATLGGISGSASVTVSNPSLAGITITPGTASIDAVIGTQQFSASCSYADNTSSVCTSTVTWSSSNNGFATISTGGLATGVAAGSVTITATSGSTSGSSTLTVEPYSPPTGIHRGKWSWMDGSSTAGGSMKAIPSVLSQLDTPSATNTPGGRDGFATWTDQSGNLWLFGGGGFDANGNSGYLNDLWEFTPSTMEWAWVGGSSTVPAANQGRSGIYSTVGTPSGEAIPGGRQATASWTDSSGNLWLFGGEGFDSNGLNGDLNDLWKFTPSSQEWTWVDGSSTVPAAGKGQTGVYGTLGSAATANIPGGRWGANSWTDQNGNLWLFGGVGFDSTGASGSLNDLWEFSPASGQWTWIAGSSTVGAKGGQYDVFGTEGTAASGNVPSSRNQAVTWTDQSGNLWLFGGYGYDSTGTWGYLNDLWQFNLSSHQWAWMGGSSTVGCAGCGQAGVYGTVGTRDSSSQPGGRNQAVGWTDSSGNLWMFGGVGFDSKGVNGDLNDLWEYVLSSNQWAWVGGSNTVPASGKGQSGDYGSRGVPDSNDAPGGRWSSGAWTDPKGDLWLFGGAGYDANGNYDNLNDLWVYQPDPGTLAAATPTLSIGSGTYTGAQSVSIADQIPGATIYYTTDGSAPSTSSTVYSGPITVGAAETIQAIAVATGYGPSGLASANYTIVAPFSLGLGTGANSITVYPGGKANFNLILTPVGSSTFPTGITFTATGLPSGATATFSPATVNAGAGLTGVTFAVQTQSESPAAAMLNQPGSKTGGLTGGLLCLLFLPLAAVARWRKTARYLAKHASLMVWLLILAGITAAVTGCGGGSSINSNAVAAPAASYTITITAKSGNLQQSTTVTLNVQ
jgi:N-acetylneuraminic acid mutarotase